jgi:predicted transcriptional regulator
MGGLGWSNPPIRVMGGGGTMNGRRSDLEVVAEILKLAKKRAGQTRIMYGCNLNHERVRGYLTSLEMKGLIECSRLGPHAEYVTTDKGMYFLQHLEIAVAALENEPAATHSTSDDSGFPLQAGSATG